MSGLDRLAQALAGEPMELSVSKSAPVILVLIVAAVVYAILVPA